MIQMPDCKKNMALSAGWVDWTLMAHFLTTCCRKPKVSGFSVQVSGALLRRRGCFFGAQARKKTVCLSEQLYAMGCQQLLQALFDVFDDNLGDFFAVPTIPSKFKNHAGEFLLLCDPLIDVEMDSLQGVRGRTGGLSQYHAPVVSTHHF